MESPVISVIKKPKNHANKIAEKKEGIDMPKTEITKDSLSIKESLKIAERTPNKIPKKRAIQMEASVKTNVLGKVSVITEVTDFPLLTNDSLKYGHLITKVELSLSKIVL